jgi:hypothetical protein
MDPVPDPLLLRKSGSAGNWARDLRICSQKLWPLDHRGGQPLVPTSNYNAIANLHTLQITRPHAKYFQFSFTSRFLVTDLNNEDSSTSVLTSLLPGEYPTTQLSPLSLSKSKVKVSYFTTGGLPPINLSWRQVHWDSRRKIFFNWTLTVIVLT